MLSIIISRRETSDCGQIFFCLIEVSLTSIMASNMFYAVYLKLMLDIIDLRHQRELITS